jgi:hypothetical protein
MAVLASLSGCADTATRDVVTQTTASSPATSLAPPVSTPPYECTFTEDSIKIDGTLDDAA